MRVKSASLGLNWVATFAAIAGSSLALVGCATHPVSTGAPIVPGWGDSRGASPAGAAADARSGAAAVMVGSAESMLGQPYRYGGAAPGGFDCSGLVSFAARRAGFDLPRTAKDQLRSGVLIGREELEPGDLVFMRLAHKQLHVGIAIGGERFVHAPARGGHVRIDSLAAAPYAAGFVEARRVIGLGGRGPGA